MYLENLINRGSIPVLESVMSFTEARQEVLANNISNFDTVGYKMKDLPAEEFFTALRKAVVNRTERGGAGRLEVENTQHIKWDKQGRMHLQPVKIRDNNILFHDGNNRFVEKQMSTMAKNAILHNVTTELLKGRYDMLKTAISGRI